MLKTDYSKIAGKYDLNILRHEIPEDKNIEIIYQKNNNEIKILDLACGTGNYIQKQKEYYQSYNIKWFGIDLSPEMLQKAKDKKIIADFVVGDALNLPFSDNYFDYIKIRFAFHHFQDKNKAVNEVYRTLKPEGKLSIFNLSHDYMKNSWVYKYFPGVIEIDKKRFLDSQTIYSMLRNSGFDVNTEIIVNIKEFFYNDILKEVLNRDMSQLNLINDNEYEEGVKMLKIDSGKNEYFLGDIAFLNYNCIKK